LENGPGRETDSGPGGPNGLDDGISYRSTEARTILDTATPLIGALVASILGELVDEVADTISPLI